ncbi:MAG TPA: TolC family protein [bacterium]|nr:TolC family protein [bacterium]HPG44088.1 TolC family protein [bacterium]HPM96454.1 TolC family protein [bacterium]
MTGKTLLRSVSLLFALVGTGFGQLVSLDECIEIALKNNSTLRNAERREQAAGTQVTDAWSAFLPTISTSLSAGKSIRGARVDQENVPVGYDSSTNRMLFDQQQITQPRSEFNSHSASISLNQNLWDFGRSSNVIRQSKALQSASRFSREQTELDVVLQVKIAYFELLKQLHLQEVYEKAVALAQQQLDEAQTRLDIGLVSKAEVYAARVNLGSNRAALLEQQNLVEFGRADLNYAIGRDPGTPIEVTEDRSEPIFPDQHIEQAVETAIAGNKTIKIFELEARSNLFAYQAAKARYMPALGFGASYSRANDDYSRVYSSNLDEDYSVNLGLSFQLNLFNGFTDQAAIQRQQLSYEIALEDLTEARRIVIANVKQYFLRLAAYRDLLEINRENIEAAEENLRLQQERRRVGSGTELEVAQAQVQLTEAHSSYVRAEYDAKIARARLESVLGISSR